MLRAKLVVVGGDAKAAEIQLKLPTIIGRGREVNLTLPHPLVSRQHCELFEREGKLLVRDLKSLNGTYVDSKRIEETEFLKPDQLLTIGNVTFRAVYRSHDQTNDETEMLSGGETLTDNPERSVIEIENVADADSDSKDAAGLNESDSIHSRPTQPGKRPSQDQPENDDVEFDDIRETVEVDKLVKSSKPAATYNDDTPTPTPEHSVCAALQDAGLASTPGDATISDIRGQLPEAESAVSSIEGLSSISDEPASRPGDSFKGINAREENANDKIQPEESSLGSFIRKLPR